VHGNDAGFTKVFLEGLTWMSHISFVSSIPLQFFKKKASNSTNEIRNNDASDIIIPPRFMSSK
jgi:hypothetical protein